MTDGSNAMTGLAVCGTKLLRVLFNVLATLVIGCLLLAGLNFPYDYDRPLTEKEVESARKYYEDAYRREPNAKTRAETEYQTRYESIAAAAAQSLDVMGTVQRFVEKYGLAGKAVLDIGSGRGYLQDAVENYTGLDISPSVASFYHKKFVIGSATSMPFADNSFDAAWSIWVFEHVPNPEQAFKETRRVTKHGGILLLMPAWNCVSWAADGYLFRPYSDFNLRGKLIKASLSIRVQPIYAIVTLAPVRAIRAIATKFGPTKLRYHRLNPNYETYWQPDSDAVNSIDSYEAAIWFISRGDECLNCAEANWMDNAQPLVIRVNKGP